MTIPTSFPDPTITELINDRIDFEKALTRVILPFLEKYPRATHEIEFRARYGDHLAPIVRIKSTF
jgi:hypothetical protein